MYDENVEAVTTLPQKYKSRVTAESCSALYHRLAFSKKQALQDPFVTNQRNKTRQMYDENVQAVTTLEKKNGGVWVNKVTPKSWSSWTIIFKKANATRPICDERTKQKLERCVMKTSKQWPRSAKHTRVKLLPSCVSRRSGLAPEAATMSHIDLDIVEPAKNLKP